MKIGIDISQSVYEGTGVAKHVREITKACVQSFPHHEYVLFGSSFRKIQALIKFTDEIRKINKRIRTVIIPLPLSVLNILWNIFHICPIQLFIGSIDVFWSSDWIQPPIGKARGVTTIHDVSFLHYPESFDTSIISVQKRRLYWAKRECDAFFCDSIATKKDVQQFFQIEQEKLFVVYPGYAQI